MSTLEKLVAELEAHSRSRATVIFDSFAGRLTEKEKEIEKQQTIKKFDHEGKIQQRRDRQA